MLETGCLLANKDTAPFILYDVALSTLHEHSSEDLLSGARCGWNMGVGRGGQEGAVTPFWLAAFSYFDH